MLNISIQNLSQNLQVEHERGLIELGRGPQRDTIRRCVVEDLTVSRDQLQIEELSPGRVRLQNLSQGVPVALAGGATIPTGTSGEFALPVLLTLGATTVAISAKVGVASPCTDPGWPLGDTHVLPDLAPIKPPMSAKSLAAEGFFTIAQPVGRRGSASPSVGLGDAPNPETLAQWMESVLALQRSGTGPAEFCAEAARTLVELIGLDIGLVLLRRDGAWQVIARASRDDDDSRLSFGREFSQTVLDQVVSERRTFYQDLAPMNARESLKNIAAVVASPIFGLQDDIVGTLYGLRRVSGLLTGCKIRPLEAQLVQLVAAAVGDNLARTAAARTRVQFEQFFSPELVRQLELDPRLLEGRGQEVTILVSDLRNFSSLSERLGPKETCRLVRDVMERLSERIVEHGGAIVSYLGDGILAMWNAPIPQADHAVLACRAALAMQQELPQLNAIWQPIVGAPLAVGIGLNTGTAQVGNTGSQRKFMYGPLGNTVNLASRVEGATKHLGVPVLITGSTQALLGDVFVTRRLCKVRVVGINEPVDLYELYGETAAPEWLARQKAYETGLELFENRNWLAACQTLLPLLNSAETSSPHDQATLKLMRRCWSCLETPPDSFEPLLELFTK